MKVNKAKFYKSLTVAAPIVGIVFGGGTAIYEVRRLNYLQEKYASTTKELTEIDRILAEFAAQPPMDKVPTEPTSTREQPMFLDMLRGYADRNHIQMVRWSNIALPPPPTNGDGAAKPAASSVTPIVSTVEVSGEYSNMRLFMYSLLKSPRLLNMTELRWVRGDQWPLTHLTFTLTRYVGPPEASPTISRMAQNSAPNPGSRTLLQNAAIHLQSAALHSGKTLTPIQAGQSATDATSNAFNSVEKSSSAESETNRTVGGTDKSSTAKGKPQ